METEVPAVFHWCTSVGFSGYWWPCVPAAWKYHELIWIIQNQTIPQENGRRHWVNQSFLVAHTGFAGQRVWHSCWGPIQGSGQTTMFCWACVRWDACHPILPSMKSLRQESCNEHLPCSGDVDCAFDSWTQWSACTRTDSSLSLDHLYSFVLLYRISLVQFMSVHDIQLTCT